MSSRYGFRGLLTGCALLACGLPSLAQAQHVVTEDEAGKLTLEALTATPIYHPTYRAYLRPAMATRTLRHAVGRRTEFHEAAYRGHAHRGSAHRRRA